MLQEESGTCRANYGGNSTGSHGAVQPGVNAEGGGSSSSLSSEGAPEVGWARKGCKLGGLGSDNETEDEETNRREKMGG